MKRGKRYVWTRLVSMTVVICLLVTTAVPNLYALAPKSKFVSRYNDGERPDREITAAQSTEEVESPVPIWDSKSEKAIGQIRTLLVQIYSHHLKRFSATYTAFIVLCPMPFMIALGYLAALVHFPAVVGAAVGYVIYFNLMDWFAHQDLINKWMTSFFMFFGVGRKLEAEIMLTAGMFLSSQDEKKTRIGLETLERIALDMENDYEAFLAGFVVMAIESEYQKICALNRRPLPPPGKALPTILSDWEDMLGKIPYAYRYAAYALTAGHGKVPAYHYLLGKDYLDRQAALGSPWAAQLLIEIAAINPAVPQIISSAEKAMLSRAMEGNLYIQTVLGDLGSPAPISATPERIGELTLTEKNSLNVMPFNLNDTGHTFFSDLFQMDSRAMKASLVTIRMEEKMIALPYAFILEDDQSKTLHHLQVLALSYGAGNRNIRTIRFLPGGLGPYYDDLFHDFTNTLGIYRPGYRVQGAVFRLSHPWIHFYESEKQSQRSERIQKEAGIMYLTQPEPKDTARSYTWTGGLMGDGPANYDKDILFNPRSIFHYQYIGDVDDCGKNGEYKDKDIGIIGTGQGADIVQILHHRPRSIKANDIQPVAVIVSRWNVHIAQETGIAPDDIPVEIIQGSGIHGIGNPDAVFWHTPVIKPDTIADSNTSEIIRDFADQHNRTNFELRESDFHTFLRELATLLNNPGKFAVLRIDLDRKLLERGETADAAKMRYLLEANLVGKGISPSESGSSLFWQVTYKSGATKDGLPKLTNLLIQAESPVKSSL